MRIIHVYDGHERVFPGEGSVPSVVYQIAKYTAEKGHDVTVLERKWEGLDYKEEIDRIKFERFDLKICSNVSNKEIVYEQIKKPSGALRLIMDRVLFAVKANNYLKKNDFDIVHVHLPFAANVLINLHRKLREKMVYTAHADEYRLGLSKFLKPPLAARIFSPDLYLMKRVKKSTVLNKALKEKLIAKGIEEEKLEVIPNGVNVDDFNLSKGEIERVKEKYELNETTIMFSGTVTPRKGVEYLVKAAEILKESNALFLIVGNINLDREYANKVMEYAKLRNLKIRFTGFVPYEDLKALYSACDIFVLPSLEEGFGMVLTEALASGKPLIGSNVGGIPMQIKDGWNGFLVEPANEKQLAEKIRYLIENEEEIIRMGKNSRKLAEEKFDWEKIAGKYLEVYENVAGVS